MKIKRYIGKSTQEAMYKLKRELGSEAIILHTRKIRHPGFLGLFRKSLVEVVAALEKDAKEQTLNSKSRENESKNNTQKNKEMSKVQIDYNKQGNVDINTEIKNIKGLLEQTIKTMEYNGVTELPNELKKYRSTLINNGVDGEIANNILKTLANQINIKNKDNDFIKKVIKDYIYSYIGEPSPISLNDRQKVIFFVGPTGVGKTTTIAKIAADLILQGEKNIGLITADTYRIAAVDQIRTYSEILNIPLKVVYEVEEIYGAVSNFKDKDVILVDTAGRNHKSEDSMLQIKSLLDSVVNKETYLVLNSTTDLNVVKSILQQYNFIENFKLIFTKIDEANGLGIILNTKYYCDKPLSYITIGQNVPEDIEIINSIQLCETLIGE